MKTCNPLTLAIILNFYSLAFAEEASHKEALRRELKPS